jgi:hypothetical protein
LGPPGAMHMRRAQVHIVPAIVSPPVGDVIACTFPLLTPMSVFVEYTSTACHAPVSLSCAQRANSL